MSDVFLSYSRKDMDIMQKMRDVLGKAGLDVWTDQELEPGTPAWQSAISNAIEEARCVVVLLSPEAKTSKWVLREIGYAEDWELRIFPILVRGGERESVPLLLIDRQRLDLRDNNFDAGIHQLTSALQRWLGAEGSASEIEITRERDMPERYEKRPEFWRHLIERSKGRTRLFADISPSSDYYMGTGAGKSGLKFHYYIYVRRAVLDLYIDAKNYTLNKQYFDKLYNERDQIEAEFGHPLDWRRLDDNRASRIVFALDGSDGLATPKSWDALQDRMIDSMIKLDKVLRPRIQNL
ncbi:MAG: DUF4268 domain-containing protein [Anaerolineae bacterium]|nr:DUF4268 domain-containing protein [Anaerolineae bacterium]